MKTLCRTFVLILLATIAIVAFLSCATKFDGYNYGHVIGEPNAQPPRYQTFKKGDDNESDFRRALSALKGRGGACDITFLHTSSPHHPHPTPEPHHYHDICERGGTVHLKTGMVIKSKNANNTAGQPAANDPNVTWRVMSDSQQDVDAVMATLNP
jgi:hypothetical protein